jgi:hypothetical protein
MRHSIAQWHYEFCLWLDQTPLSQAIQSHGGTIVPTVQTIHILSVAIVATSALMIGLRLLGAFGRDQSLDRVAARFLPLVWWPLPVLLATGTIMIIGEPARSLRNPAFQLKMALLVTAMIVTYVMQSKLRRDPAFADRSRTPRGATRLTAVVSLLLWVGIIFAGRWIAYI